MFDEIAREVLILSYTILPVYFKERRKLALGQAGKKKYYKKYGKNLLCVRYKYNIAKKEKIKTIELIVKRQPWEPEGKKIPVNKIVSIRIYIDELELRQKVKMLSGRWNSKEKVWKIAYGKVKI
jgi:hypothetical protein